MKKIIVLIMGIMGCQNAVGATCAIRNSEVCKTPDGFNAELKLGCANEASNCLKKFCAQNCTKINTCPTGDAMDLCRQNCAPIAIKDESFKSSYCFASDLSSGYLRQVGQQKMQTLATQSVRKQFESQLKEYEKLMARREELRAQLIASGAGDFVKEIERNNDLRNDRITAVSERRKERQASRRATSRSRSTQDMASMSASAN